MARKKKPEPLTMASLVRGSVRNHGGRNEKLYVREKGSAPALRGAIVDELTKLATGAVKNSEAHSKSGRAPRSNLRKVVAQVVHDNPIGWTLKDLKPCIEAAIEAWNDEHGEELEVPGDKYLGELILWARGTKRAC